MHARTLAYIAILLWLLTVIAVAIVFVRGRTAPAPDGRTSVLLNAPERDMVLMEMRGLLQSTQGHRPRYRERRSRADRDGGTRQRHGRGGRRLAGADGKTAA